MSVVTKDISELKMTTANPTSIGSGPGGFTAPSTCSLPVLGTSEPPPVKGLFDLTPASTVREKELLRDRFLCREDSPMITGPTGIGKSSFGLQAAIHWALERDCFGIFPAQALKSLLIQGENDEQDLVEMRDGVVGGMELTAKEKALLSERMLICTEDQRTGQTFSREVVEPLLKKHRPDLVWLDPLL